MTQSEARPDLEWEYNNRARVPEHAEITARWEREAAAFRAAANAELDIIYGPSERQRFDLFHPENGSGDAPLAAFIHGGYWQRGDRKTFSGLARSFTARGITIAMPSYDLCPKVSVMDIVEQMRAFLAALWQRTGRRMAVFGHSAGGHLTAAMVATDWSARDGVPDDLVLGGYAISGVFDLPPLIETSINDALGLTAETAAAASPLGWPVAGSGRRLIAAYGEAESSEFARQAETIADVWGGKGVETACVAIAGANHFTMLDQLADPESAMVARIAALAEGAE